MSSLYRVALATALAALSMGCCLTQPCGPTLGCGATSNCGAEGRGVVPCEADGRYGCCLGLGCLGKLFRIADYGCGGCGERYIHDWISDPPCPDPCDCDGNWTGQPCGGSCGHTCGGGCAGVIEQDVLSYGGDGAVGEWMSAGDAPCSSCTGIGMGSTSCCQTTGRLVYRTWTGVGHLIRGIRHGFLPACGSCNAFSISSPCTSCSWGHEFIGGSMATDGPIYSEPEVLMEHGSTTASSFPHPVAQTRPIRSNRSRPPHPVLAQRLRP